MMAAFLHNGQLARVSLPRQYAPSYAFVLDITAG
jgi:hypothetical protein